MRKRKCCGKKKKVNKSSILNSIDNKIEENFTNAEVSFLYIYHFILEI